MQTNRLFARIATLAVLVAGLSYVPVAGQQPSATTPAIVPSDLRPLLAPRQSEMRLVTQRYTADRGTLSNYFSPGGGRAGGRGGQAETIQLSAARIARLKRFDMDWQAGLAKLDPARLTPAARTELDSLKAAVAKNLEQLVADTAARAELDLLVPFAGPIVDLSEARIRLEDVDARKAAGVLTEVARQIAAVRARLERGLTKATTDDAFMVTKDRATRAAAGVDAVRSALSAWFGFYNGYDPIFTWWMGMPNTDVDAALESYAAFLRDTVAAADGKDVNVPTVPLAEIEPAPAPRFPSVPDLQELIALPQDEMTAVVQVFLGQPAGGRGGRGNADAPPRDRQYYLDWRKALGTLDFDALTRNAQVDYLFIRKSIETQLARMDTKPQTDAPRKTDNSGITGPARGRDGLIQDLREELIEYTPEELIALAERELAWCIEEYKKASRQMGLGDDWKKAIEKVKDLHVPPGGQPAMIRDLLYDAIAYLRTHDLITVPAVAAESLRMAMMSPQRQLVNPFFTGGSQITVSYPTDTMTYDQRIQSMRGNNDGFSNATAGHEMIPGHNLVSYMGARYGTLYRARIGGNTPFFGEGWPVYWETILYDKGFHNTPEKRIGALFWRMHRCARIIFSLKFHMGQWSPQESIDFLVDTVGHERENAIAEVRRSFEGSYSPLYQAAYLLGALQLRGLRKEVVDSGQMTEKQFHDEVMRQGSMPIGWLRLALTKQKLTRDMPVDWKFYGDLTQSASGYQLAAAR
jgi:hypothetical protein